MRPLEKHVGVTNVTYTTGDEEYSSSSQTSGRNFVMPEIGTNSIYAATAKVAGRLNATTVSAAEHQALLRERQELLDCKFAGEITKKQENRLAYVRWSLDRIEDAKHGSALDILEENVARYEHLLAEVSKVSSQIQAHLHTGRRK